VLVACGCAQAPKRFADEGRSCTVETFVAAPAYACRKEACLDGKVSLVEDLTGVAPVDDWAEERFCALQPLKCLEAYRMKKESDEWLKGLVGQYWPKNQTRYGVGDAVRHVYTMCRFAERFGPEFARGLGIAHEEDSGYLMFSTMGAPSNFGCEREMDLYNNEVGIALAKEPGTCGEKALAAIGRMRHSLCPGKTDDYPDE